MIQAAYQKIQKTTDEIEKGTYRKPIKKGRNIFVEFIPEAEEYDEHLYITAHHDSTTLSLSLKPLKVLMFITVLAALVYIFGYVINYVLVLTIDVNIFANYASFFLIVLIVFLCGLSVLLISRAFRTNKSHGANDDLTGVALVLELARIAKRVQPKLKITFIAFDAEEIGLYGSSYHYHSREQYFEAHSTRVLTLDMIGETPPLLLISKIKPFLGIPMAPEFNEEMARLGEQLEIEVKERRFTYPGSDFANWFLNGHPANWIISASKFVHSPADIAENVNQDLLRSALKLLTAYLVTKC
jgi:hypothetical protein